MGVSIHYAGELKSPKTTKALLREMIEFSDETGWSFDPIPMEVFHVPKGPPLRAQGLLVKVHQECEPLNLVFNEDGRLVNFLYLAANTVDPDPGRAPPIQKSRINYLFQTKTAWKTTNQQKNPHFLKCGSEASKDTVAYQEGFIYSELPSR